MKKLIYKTITILSVAGCFLLIGLLVAINTAHAGSVDKVPAPSKSVVTSPVTEEDLGPIDRYIVTRIRDASGDMIQFQGEDTRRSYRIPAGIVLHEVTGFVGYDNGQLVVIDPERGVTRLNPATMGVISVPREASGLTRGRGAAEGEGPLPY